VNANVAMAALDAADDTLANNGGTYSGPALAVGPDAPRPLTRVHVTTGYAVGGLAAAGVIDVGAPRQAIADAIAGMFERCDAPYVGTWVDGGRIYVDAVIILPDLATAGIIARTLRERAIYDLANGIEIASGDAR
jgi:hypothetical protein